MWCIFDEVLVPHVGAASSQNHFILSGDIVKLISTSPQLLFLAKKKDSPAQAK
jgi:hypothetical protein